jgi:quercetin dioxygenase-like cupin family protein
MKRFLAFTLMAFILAACSEESAQIITEDSTVQNRNHSSEIGKMEFPEGEVQHVIHVDEINWGPCPPGLPESCSICVLEGNPKNADLFSVRFKFSDEFYMPAHTHPKDERVTILEGRAYVAFGKGARKEKATVFNSGDYYVNARNEIHTVWADSGAVLQITGIGPWEVDFVE